MSYPTKTPRRALRLMPALAALTASLALAACGSGSTSSSSTTATSASAPATGGSSANRAAFVQCLKNHGIALPARATSGGTSTTHAGPPPGGAGGANSSARQAAFKACGASGQRFGGSATTPAG